MKISEAEVILVLKNKLDRSNEYIKYLNQCLKYLNKTYSTVSIHSNFHKKRFLNRLPSSSDICDYHIYLGDVDTDIMKDLILKILNTETKKRDKVAHLINNF